MALLNCPECRKPVSDLADACPHCGLPKPAEAIARRREANKFSPHWALLSLGVLVVIVAILVRIGRPENAPSPVPTPNPPSTVGPTDTETETPTPTQTLPPQSATAAARQTTTAVAVAQRTATAEAASAARTATAEAIQRETAWRYSEEQDAIGRGTVRYAWTKSTWPLEFKWPYGTQYADLMIRKGSKYGLDVMVRFEKAHFLCPSYDGCSVSVRFGDGKVQRFSAVGAADHSTDVLFIQNEGAFVAALKRARTVRIEADFYQDGRQMMEFNTNHFVWK